MMRMLLLAAAASAMVVVSAAASSPVPAVAAAAPGYFALHCVDKATGRGVPRVELTSVDHTVWVTDSNGLAAVEVTGREGLNTFFTVATDGYEVPADAFGNRDVQAKLVAGGNATVELTRTQKAERLYRLTGFGVFFDSVLLNAAVPTAQPLLNGGVLGQDSILSVVFDKKTRWFWGDTNHMSYPLGNFETSGATSCAPSSAAAGDDSEVCMSPEVGIDLTYFTVPDPTRCGNTALLPFCPTYSVSFRAWFGKLHLFTDVLSKSSPVLRSGGVFTKKMASFDMNLGAEKQPLSPAISSCLPHPLSLSWQNQNIFDESPA